jgi:hypothetical protein
VYRFALVLPALFLFALLVAAQQPQQNPARKPQNSPDYSAILVQAAKEPNPVKATPESLTRAKKWWAMDCAMCHGDSGNGKGDMAVDMKLNVVDFTDPNTLKDRTDGEFYYIIKKRPSGHATRRSPHQDRGRLGSGEQRPVFLQEGRRREPKGDEQKGSSKAETPVATRDGEQKGAPVMNACEIERSSREAAKEWSRRPRAWVPIRRIQQVL